MADFLDEKRSEIEARLKELRPLVEEFQRLEAAAAALAGVSPALTPVSAATRPTARAAKSKRTSSRAGTGGRRGRPKGSGKRGDEALALVTAQPGITIPEIAERMGIKQNYLYRVLPTRERGARQEGRPRLASRRDGVIRSIPFAEQQICSYRSRHRSRR